MRALRDYKPNTSSNNSELKTNENRLIYYPLMKKNSTIRNKILHKKSKSLEVQFKENVRKIPNGIDQGCYFFFKFDDESTIQIDNQETFTNFNCSACNKWFFCKRFSDHEKECAIINKFKGAGDKTDFPFDTHLNISNNNMIRQSIVCYLCGNRYSLRSIIYHEERCLVKFRKFFDESDLPKKPEIILSDLSEIVRFQHLIGNNKFANIDALNDIMFKESLKNEELLKSRLRYF